MLTPRDPKRLAGEDFDLLVVGGGVYGIMVLLEAVRRGLRALLIERSDFGARTSHNSLRVVHGGLRYLQTLDLHRFRESVAERRWFLRHFPDLVEPLPCLMPLYGNGLHRPEVLRAALLLNDALSRMRNQGVAPERALPDSRVLDAREARNLESAVDPRGLRGAALWYDAFIPNTPRFFIEALRWACAHGGQALNYVEARALVRRGDRIVGLRALDLTDGTELEFRAETVVNAAGPWSPAFAAACGAAPDGLFTPTLAWNLVFDREAPSDHALAVRPRRPGGQVYFLVPWKGVLLAGTGHAPWTAGPDDPFPSSDHLRTFVDDLTQALPALDLREADIARVFAGLLPAAAPGTTKLTAREVIVDHGTRGGPRGLFSISGIKLTTARRVADKVLRRAFPSVRARPYEQFERPLRVDPAPEYPFAWEPAPGDRSWKEPLRRALAEDAVQRLEDLVLRRSSLGDNPARAVSLAPEAAQLFDWDAQRTCRELAALEHRLGRLAETRRTGGVGSGSPGRAAVDGPP